MFASSISVLLILHLVSVVVFEHYYVYSNLLNILMKPDFQFHDL